MSKRSRRWIPVATAVQARMKVAGMHRKADLYRAAKLSEPTVRPLITAELRDGQEPSTITCEVVSTALGWTADSIQRILDGKPPVLAPVDEAVSESDPPSRLDAVEAVARSQAQVVRLLAREALGRLGADDELAARLADLERLLAAQQAQ